MKTAIALTFLSLNLYCASVAQALSIDTVPIGNAGNVADVQNFRTFGAVTYNYNISKTEVTNAQYAEFLKAVATSDPYGLYNTNMGSQTTGGITRSGSSGNYTYAVKEVALGKGPGGLDGDDYAYDNKPVIRVSWFDSIRFANWLHNGQPTDGSGTEDGAYTLGPLGAGGVPLNSLLLKRNPNAKWVLPSEDEWYKAAYHKNDGVSGNYWDYPTSTDVRPNNNLPSADTGNSANYFIPPFRLTTLDVQYPMTDAGAYLLSDSPYGTFDQGGNVFEWNETRISGSSNRIQRGGSWNFFASDLIAGLQLNGDPASEDSRLGFRVATSVPEPMSMILGVICGIAILARRSR